MLLSQAPRATGAFTFNEDSGAFQIITPNYVLHIGKDGFRYGFERPNGEPIAPAHGISGLEFGGAAAVKTRLRTQDEGRLSFGVENERGDTAVVEIVPEPTRVRFGVVASRSGRIVARTGGVNPMFGLADHAGSKRRADTHGTTELTGYDDNEMRANQPASVRLISNFIIAPRAGFAAVNIEPNLRVVRVMEDECAQGVSEGTSMPALYYFLGAPAQIYQDFLKIRNRHGYRVFKPKYEWFGVGWEAWGALAWETNQRTVTDHVKRYLDSGYPLSWMVVGSGFWPRQSSNFLATTSFGLWDTNLYPNPRAMINEFHERGLKFIIGLRISFITNGPFAAEGSRMGHFIEESGTAKVFKISFPASPVYLLDAQKPEAVRWYVNLCQRWLDYGVDGFKEDLYGYGKYILRDDKIDPVNVALMERGVYVMGRNGYLGSPTDLHRFDDFNWNMNQDRGPINGLALAYSGFPYVYPDIIGGTFTIKNLPPLTNPQLKRYFMRNAQYASVHPSMAVGFGPWNFNDPEVERVTRSAARLHARLHPTIYSAAVDAFEDGFPHTFTPLSLRWPDDPEVYQLENAKRRGYQWLLGPSLLATPLYGGDCATADTRDVYLPAGKWMDYDTGEIHEGPRTLKQFALPPGKTPLFVGGPGIVVEQILETKTLRAVVYPVSPRGTRFRFTHSDGLRRSLLINDTDLGLGGAITVREAKTGADVRFERAPRTGAIQFTIEPGRDYQIAARNEESPGPAPASATPH